MGEMVDPRPELEELVKGQGQRGLSYRDGDGALVEILWSKWGTWPTVKVQKKNGATGQVWGAAGIDGIIAAIERAKREAQTEKQRAWAAKLAQVRAARKEQQRQAQIAAAAYLLVHCKYNVADEFNVESWQLMTQTEWQETVAYYGSRTSPRSVYYGNLSDEFSDGDDFLGSLTPTPISKRQYDTLLKTMGREWGTAKWPEEWGDEDEDDEEEEAA